MNMKTIVAIAAVLVVLGAGYAFARPNGFWNGMMGGFGSMMGNVGPGITGNYGSGGGMMGGGFGPGMMGFGSGYCGAGYGNSGYGVNTTPITIEKAKEAVEQYLAATGNPDLKLSEVIEFDYNFYAGIKENSTGVHAFELLVNKYTGAVIPETGPNMMWNTKYSPMGRMMVGQVGQVQATVTENNAIEYAQNYLYRVLPGTKVGDVDTFYGYYTMETLNDSKISGMLSVNAYTGAVWYHSWHGKFVEILEAE